MTPPNIYISPGVLRELAADLRLRAVTEDALDFIAMILDAVAEQGGVTK